MNPGGIQRGHLPYPWPKTGGTIAPGNDVDPDFNNNEVAGPEDYGHWFANVGKEYPYPGAWWQSAQTRILVLEKTVPAHSFPALAVC